MPSTSTPTATVSTRYGLTGSSTVAGYDPDKYLRQYRAADGDINKLRRVELCRQQGCASTPRSGRRMRRERSTKAKEAIAVELALTRHDLDYMNSAPYRAKFDSVSDNPALNQSIYKYCKAAVTHQSGDYYEDLSILRMDGSLVGQTSSKVRNETQYSRTLNAAVKSAEPYSLVSLHNHGT